MSLTIDQLPKIQEQINQALKDLLALEDVMLPAVKADIKQISDLLTVGFNQTNLKNQALKELNQALDDSQISMLSNNAKTYQNSINESIKKLQNTLIETKREATSYLNLTKTHKSLYVGVITGAVCFFAGTLLTWGAQYKRIDMYQFVIGQTDPMARYINSSCKLKQGYASFVGQKIDCDSTWSMPTEIISKKSK